MRLGRLAILFAGLAPGLAQGPAVAAGRDPGAFAVSTGIRTGKERLSDKGSDEQRVNDCKVAAARRTRDRPAACPGDPAHANRPAR